MTFPRKIILASRSPRRKELLTAAGYDFEVLPAADSAECGICSQETPPELVARLAYQKALDVATKVDKGLILGCDTVAALHGRVFGKPVDEAHARQTLLALSGREHQVYSGICLWDWPTGKPLIEVETTILKMAPLSDAVLDEYLASGLWEGKAGAFGYQDRHGWIEIVTGSESNVVGLPLERLAQMLAVLAEQAS